MMSTQTQDSQAQTLDLNTDTEQMNALYKQLDDIFGTPKEKLSAAEQKQADELNKKIEAILSSEEGGEFSELTQAQEAELNKLYDQLDALYGIKPVRKTLMQLGLGARG